MQFVNSAIIAAPLFFTILLVASAGLALVDWGALRQRRGSFADED